jgi:hypothetical protein
MAMTPRARLVVGILPLAAAFTGAYLLAWSSAWPHPDLRDAWAMIGGLLVVAVAIVAGVVAWRARGRAGLTLAVIASVAAVALGLLVLSTVSDGQAAACGTDLAVCRSLLPGL